MYDIKNLKLHKDERGYLFEAIRFTSDNIPAGGQVYVYSLEPGVRRGDHFHKYKSEWVICISGQVSLILKTKDSSKSELSLDSNCPQLVFIPPKTSHALINKSTSKSIVLAYSSDEFHPDNPDTYLLKVE